MDVITRSEIGAFALLAVACTSASMPFGPPEDIRRIASLHTPRAAHTATTLKSGKVLFVGGMRSGGASLATAELFDPATNTIHEFGALTEARLGHTATSLADGGVVVAGGYNGEYLRTVERLDVLAKGFRPGGALSEGRSGHTATMLNDGRLLLVGGVGQGWTFLSSAEIYDPRTSRSAAVGRMSVPREGHTATLLNDGRVLIIGGHNGRRQQMVVHASAEVFDPKTNRFEPAGSLGTARHKHDAVLRADGRVLVIGGADRTDRVHFATTEIYDPVAGTFAPGPAMAHRRYKIAGTAVVLENGDVLVTSGARSAELLRADRSTFEPVPGNLPDAYRFAAVARLSGGDVIVSGGYSDTNENTGGIWRFRSR